MPAPPSHRQAAATHLCREVPVVQEKQGVPRLGGVGEQLVTPLPGDHSDLIGELSVRAEGTGTPPHWKTGGD